MIKFQIENESDEGTRLDHYLTSSLSDYSRSKIQSWIKGGFILVNGQRKKNGYALELNDEIQCQFPKQEIIESELSPENIPLNIIHEDDAIIVLNKQAGLVVHPGKGNPTGTLVNGLVHHFNQLSDLNGELRPGIVHRLDADTSGIIVIAKTNQAHVSLADQFLKRQVKKTYCALTWGLWDSESGEINASIGRQKKDPTSFQINVDGREAITRFELDQNYRHLSTITFFPKTGRTHQIRVHAAYMGHPIFGDEKYGGGVAKTKGFLQEFSQFYKRQMKRFDRHALHAKAISFIHPTLNKPIIFEAPLPSEYLNLVNAIESFYDS